MKKVVIYQEGNEPITLFDEEDDRSIQEYTEELSNLLNSGNISILMLPNLSITIRPSKVNSFLVEEVNPTQQNQESLEENHEDVIMDA